MKDFQYIAPVTLQEAVDFLKDKKPGEAVVMAGGTDIVTRLRERLIAPDYVVDIKNIPGLSRIAFSEQEGLCIGALATMSELAADENVQRCYPYLAQAADSVGSRQVRNRATCIGNIVNASPLADTATPLYCCDAVVEITGSGGARSIPIRDFILFVRKVDLQPGEIVTGIRVPYIPGTSGVFRKVSRRNQADLSTVCGTVLKAANTYRIAMGAVAPTPVRLVKTEALLSGDPLSAARIDEAAALAATEVSPIDDIRADKQYRLDIVRYLVRDALTKLQ